MRDSSRFPCHHRVWLGPVLGWPWLVTEHCSQWSGYCSSDQGEGTADGEAIGDNLGNWVRGSHGRVKAGPGVSVSQGLLPPGSLLRLRLTDLTSFAEAGPLSMLLMNVSVEWTMNNTREESLGFCVTPPPCSLCGRLSEGRDRVLTIPATKKSLTDVSWQFAQALGKHF